MAPGRSYTRAMIWRRWRERAGSALDPGRPEPFRDLLEEAPMMALLLDRENRIIAANQAARDFFAIDPRRLPASALEVTREGRLFEALRAGGHDQEVRLAHRRLAMRIRLAPGPRAGDSLMFLTDVTALRRLELVRQEFVANLSHELKTPVTSLRLAAESLLGDPPQDARRRFATRTVKEADHLAAIIDNLRQLAEIEGGGLVLRPSRFTLADLVTETAERMQLERPLTLSLAAGVTVVADRSKLAQALGNLMDNAAKFSPPGSSVDISSEPAGAEVLIRVRDRGLGISPEHWDRVFERFYKVDPARTRETPGSGLGLAITKHLVLAQGGRVWTEAAGDGGQVFGIALPAGPISEPITCA